MKCPYCSSELINGVINTPPETFQFFPEGVKTPKLRSRWNKTKGAIIIKEFRMFERGGAWMYTCPAHYCDICNIVIIGDAISE